MLAGGEGEGAAIEAADQGFSGSVAGMADSRIVAKREEYPSLSEVLNGWVEAWFNESMSSDRLWGGAGQR